MTQPLPGIQQRSQENGQNADLGLSSMGEQNQEQRQTTQQVEEVATNITEEETYIFDAVYAITGSQLSGSFSVYIDYDVTFYTPQLAGGEEYVSFYSNSPRADPQAVLKGGAQVTRQGNNGFVVNLARSFSNVLA